MGSLWAHMGTVGCIGLIEEGALTMERIILQLSY